MLEELMIKCESSPLVNPDLIPWKIEIHGGIYKITCCNYSGLKMEERKKSLHPSSFFQQIFCAITTCYFPSGELFPSQQLQTWIFLQFLCC